VWVPPDLAALLGERAMRNFWPHFDEFYFGAEPVLRLQTIDGVIGFPSFHAVVGFLTFAMWRKNIWTRVIVAAYLIVELLSTLIGGGHYFVDLLGGFAVWAIWFGVSRYVEERAVVDPAPVRP
jgi:membrane-associated phospholipid phosphatase